MGKFVSTNNWGEFILSLSAESRECCSFCTGLFRAWFKWAWLLQVFLSSRQLKKGSVENFYWTNVRINAWPLTSTCDSFHGRCPRLSKGSHVFSVSRLMWMTLLFLSSSCFFYCKTILWAVFIGAIHKLRYAIFHVFWPPPPPLSHRVTLG
jgi:hypothetical protein